MGLSPTAICEKLKIKELPRALITYLFCSPTFNGELRCLPRSGGYLDQDQIEMLTFRIIENRIFTHMKREYEKRKKTSARGTSKGPIRSVIVPEKDL